MSFAPVNALPSSNSLLPAASNISNSRLTSGNGTERPLVVGSVAPASIPEILPPANRFTQVKHAASLPNLKQSPSHIEMPEPTHIAQHALMANALDDVKWNTTPEKLEEKKKCLEKLLSNPESMPKQLADLAILLVTKQASFNHEFKTSSRLLWEKRAEEQFKYLVKNIGRIEYNVRNLCAQIGSMDCKFEYLSKKIDGMHHDVVSYKDEIDVSIAVTESLYSNILSSEKDKAHQLNSYREESNDRHEANQLLLNNLTTQVEGLKSITANIQSGITDIKNDINQLIKPSHPVSSRSEEISGLTNQALTLDDATTDHSDDSPSNLTFESKVASISGALYTSTTNSVETILQPAPMHNNDRERSYRSYKLCCVIL